MKQILTINPGATSTKIAMYQDTQLAWKEEITYSSQDLAKYDKIFDQFSLRLADIEEVLASHQVTKLDLAVGRGGLIGPVKSGAIKVNQSLVDHLQYHPVLEHASNLGAKLAWEISKKHGTGLALIYDPVTVDSMSPVARLTGIKGIERRSIGHHLNMRAVARKAAEKVGKSYDDANLIVVHLGGGSSASAHKHGQVIDFVSDDEIMFSAERSGGLPIKAMLPVIKEMGLDKFNQLIRKRGGLYSYFGTTDLRVVEEKIAQGDQEASLVFDALCLGISKTIAALSVSIAQPIDQICLTGGMARSNLLCKKVEERVHFIAPLAIYPGEFELEALALGGFRVLNQEEEAQELSFDA
ncbi:butyrate kinase [Lactobacillus pasteurii DSM 23907 = CRBIP 24.76]|uniref:Probable butyrate kinase n=1 Tax=Lactobacillus pasteurii DSM 23907 = CRBIP 24.76 TaxID=1423790 RepID=I7LAW9_9LACO|nr:butyrate kinase [Lactobacillus pasteurii]KRK07476.1 butyrate kinase [Lactobacillus pasteurii DSM 23907 = CRBIP 24.76]TDG76723.1 hypothetical protein C5L33_000284 [Lactobacillus pasteurii]CCI85041.1 Probable butyrate kinase [Lactobacillus pasteurii DSM 23907 = CRBIP 24.76]